MTKFPPLRVLIVEDSPTQAASLAAQLRALNCDVYAAESLAKAFSHLAEGRPELMIVDLNLGDELGWPLIERTRRSVDPLVVVLSGSLDPTDVQRARMSNAQHILKPARIDQLKLMIGAARDRTRRQGRRTDDRR